MDSECICSPINRKMARPWHKGIFVFG
jgi:hypothetical protein